MVYKFRAVAECEAYADPEDAVGDASVISCAAVYRRNSDSIADYFFAIGFAVNENLISDCADRIEIVYEDVIYRIYAESSA